MVKSMYFIVRPFQIQKPQLQRKRLKREYRIHDFVDNKIWRKGYKPSSGQTDITKPFKDFIEFKIGQLVGVFMCHKQSPSFALKN